VQELEAASPLVDAALSNVTELDAPITVFAPTNEAFMEISGVLAELDPELILAVRFWPLSPQFSSADDLTLHASPWLPLRSPVPSLFSRYSNCDMLFVFPLYEAINGMPCWVAWQVTLVAVT
jgi:hypothetical protein